MSSSSSSEGKGGKDAKKDEKKDNKKDEERKGSTSKDQEKKEKHVRWAEGTKKASIGVGKEVGGLGRKAESVGGRRKRERERNESRRTTGRGRESEESEGEMEAVGVERKRRAPNGWVKYYKGRKPDFAKNVEMRKLLKECGKDWKKKTEAQKEEWKWMGMRKGGARH